MSTWLCGCRKGPATTFYVLWVMFQGVHTRWVAYNVSLLCDACAAKEDDPTYHRRPDEQFLRVGLSAPTKSKLVNQVLAQVIGQARSYVPKTDLQKAIARLRQISD